MYARALLTSALLSLLSLCAPTRSLGSRPGGALANSTSVAPAARVDINHASMAELMKVPGMTRTWAGRVVRFRPYRTKQDLLDRGVVTSAVYDRIRGYIVAHQ